MSPRGRKATSSQPAKRDEAKVDDANRPRVHPDVSPDADPNVRWATPMRSRHAKGQELVELDADAERAEYVDGIWINPGERAWVSKEAMARVAMLRRVTKVTTAAQARASTPASGSRATPPPRRF